jgi:hypothetical protein
MADQDLAAAFSGRNLDLSVLSDDGMTLFVFTGELNRYRFGLDPERGEAVFHFFENGKPTSYTTSQYSHVRTQVKGGRADRRQNADLLGAKDKSTLALGWSLATRGEGDNRRTFRVNLLKWESRGRSPNLSYSLVETTNIKAYLGLAWRANTFYIGVVRDGSTELMSIRQSGNGFSRSVLGKTAEGFYEEYDPVSKRFLWDRMNGTIDVAVLGGKQTYKVKLPKDAKAFLSRGAIYAQNDVLYKLGKGHKWIKVGSGVRVLSKSANGRYWLVEDPGGKVWKVRFRS